MTGSAVDWLGAQPEAADAQFAESGSTYAVTAARLNKHYGLSAGSRAGSIFAGQSESIGVQRGSGPMKLRIPLTRLRSKRADS